MPSDAALTYADHMGRFYARRFGYPPMVGRLIGYLSVCDPPDQSIGDLTEALLASRSAIAGAIKAMEAIHAVERSRAAGERMDKVRLSFDSAQARGFDVSEYEEMGALTREGLDVLADAPVGRRLPLLELTAFADFLRDRLPLMQREWLEHLEQLRASGALPRPEGADA